MAEKINILQDASKEAQYKNILPQIKAVVESESDEIANMANVSAILKQAFNFLWVGFYIVKNNQLVLGPFQGKIACTRIAFGKGVCGTAWKNNETIIVPYVELFPGHIACDSESRSEIVVPININEKVIAVLDVDNDTVDSFDETDAKYLEQITALLQVS